MNIITLSLGPLGTNCYIVSNHQDCLIFDPSGDADKIIEAVNTNELNPIAICLTHAHFDHIGALESIRNKYNIPVYLHEAESTWLSDPTLNGSSLFGLPEIKCNDADQLLNEGDLHLADFKLKALHIPGHSPGGVSFLFEEGGFIIGGDSLFQGGIGRTDLYGGDMEAKKYRE